MEPEYVPSEFPDPWRPGAVYCEASMRPSCRRLADATHVFLQVICKCSHSSGRYIVPLCCLYKVWIVISVFCAILAWQFLLLRMRYRFFWRLLQGQVAQWILHWASTAVSFIKGIQPFILSFKFLNFPLLSFPKISKLLLHQLSDQWPSFDYWADQCRNLIECPRSLLQKDTCWQQFCLSQCLATWAAGNVKENTELLPSFQNKFLHFPSDSASFSLLGQSMLTAFWSVLCELLSCFV